MDPAVSDIERFVAENRFAISDVHYKRLADQLAEHLRIKEEETQKLRNEWKKQLKINSGYLATLALLQQEIRDSDKFLKLQESNEERFRLKQKQRERLNREQQSLKNQIREQEKTIKEIKTNIKVLKSKRLDKK